LHCVVRLSIPGQLTDAEKKAKKRAKKAEKKKVEEVKKGYHQIFYDFKW